MPQPYRTVIIFTTDLRRWSRKLSLLSSSLFPSDQPKPRSYQTHPRSLIYKPISSSSPPLDPPTDLTAIRPMSSIYPFSLYPCRANHHKTSDQPWPSRLHRAILPPPPLDRTQLPLPLPSSLNLIGFDEFFGLVLFLLCLSIEKWYYIFVWKLRKCGHQVEYVFSIVFSRTQPNTKKYFSKYFLICHQTFENIFFSKKYFHLKIFYTWKTFYIEPNTA